MARQNVYAIAQTVGGSTNFVDASHSTGQKAARSLLKITTDKLAKRGWQVKVQKADSALLVSPGGRESLLELTKMPF